MDSTQYLNSIDSIISASVYKYKQKESIECRNSLPSNGQYPFNRWYEIPDVICLFVDIRNSTQLNAVHHPKSTAGVYEFFTGTAVRIMNDFNASYIDVKGDGVFALFNSDEVFRAFAAAITFKTFATDKFVPLVKQKTKDKVNIGFHMGIDQKTVLVKRVGLKKFGNIQRDNEVWAGKPINMAAKLASKSKDDELWVSDRYFNSLGNNDLVKKSCGCFGGNYTGEKSDLWEQHDVTDESMFDFDSAWVLKSYWCSVHGKKWCEDILQLD